VTLRLQLSSGLPAVLADRIQLQQVIINLVINAIDATKPVVDRPRALTIQSKLGEDGLVLVAAQDNGVGIEPDKIDRLFDTFFTSKPDGMGMGLSICRSIIEAHGGRIWASANVGFGATVQFTLPPAEVPPAERTLVDAGVSTKSVG
jgi:two-component system, LuxR family, sensor kinase FixL